MTFLTTRAPIGEIFMVMEKARREHARNPAVFPNFGSDAYFAEPLKEMYLVLLEGRGGSPAALAKAERAKMSFAEAAASYANPPRSNAALTKAERAKMSFADAAASYAQPPPSKQERRAMVRLLRQCRLLDSLEGFEGLEMPSQNRKIDELLSPLTVQPGDITWLECLGGGVILAWLVWFFCCT